MKTHWLFPNRYRLMGWILFIPSTILGLLVLHAEFRFDFLDISLSAPEENAAWVYKIIWWLSGGGDFLNGGISSMNLTDELAALGAIIGLLLIAFSKEKVEDEMISQLRLESLQWAVYVNYLVLGVLILLVHGGLFFSVMIYNLFTVLIVFIIRFRLAIRRNEKTVLMAL
ncbi:hypothetical protein [Larkinella humicola]|uniref:Uncharacterized protein n=1 Tax=Larkinella humicola TaxID=2607654 RepID=A0A5N1JCD5_9BACT|nr:hypothetical protein [Larkinella humicola]KAA9347740.1 hypothetical protein F0P93_24215 [Larkinella humicola]